MAFMSKTSKIFLFIITLISLSLLFASCTEKKNDETGKYTPGTIDGDTYSSDFTGVTFTKPSSWEYYSLEEIKEMTGIDYSQYADPDSPNAFIIEFCAHDTKGSDSILFSLSKTAYLTEDYMINKVITDTKKGCDEFGYTFSATETTDVTVFGQNFKCFSMTSTDTSGAEMIQHMLVKFTGDFYTELAYTTFNGTSLDDFIALLA